MINVDKLMKDMAKIEKNNEFRKNLRIIQGIEKRRKLRMYNQSVELNEKKAVTIYTDGACINNPGPGGWCSILKYKQYEKVIKGRENHTTNNRMELRAVIEALKLMKEPCNIKIISDSNYVVKAINEWLAGWIRIDFDGKKNDDLWREYVEVSTKFNHDITAQWIKGHNGHPENERCDEIANEEAWLAAEENDIVYENALYLYHNE